MSIYQGDFLGFSIGGIHSSQLKIVRISSGDRYEDRLLPEFKDITVEIPGGDGSYYFNTLHTKKTFKIDFAFDELGEAEIRRLSQVLGFKGIQPLIFDETPYKKYMVKIQDVPSLKYICFDSKNKVKIFKGEGSINFVAYYPYGLSTINYHRTGLSGQFEILNKGDFPIDNLQIIQKTSDVNSETGLSISLYDQNVFLPLGRVGGGNRMLKIEDVSSIDEPYFRINMKTHLIEGGDISYNYNLIESDENQEEFQQEVYDYTFVPSGKLYNGLVKGDFFQVPIGRIKINCTYLTCVKYNLVYY